MLAAPVGSYSQVLEMAADEALDFLGYVLEQREVEAYQNSLQLWATMTVNAEPEAREACRPAKPEFLQNIFGE